MKTNRPPRRSAGQLGWGLIGATLLALAVLGPVLGGHPAPPPHHVVVLTPNELASARNALPGF